MSVRSRDYQIFPNGYFTTFSYPWYFAREEGLIYGQVEAPAGLYLEERFNGAFLTLRVWGAYIWRGLYTERLIFGILRFVLTMPGAMRRTAAMKEQLISQF